MLTAQNAAQINTLLQQVALLQQEVDRLKRLAGGVRHIQAKITAVDANGDFTWVQTDFDPSGEADPFEMDGGLSGGPGYNPARERNAKTVSAFPYYAELSYRANTEDKGIVWEFAADVGFAGGCGADGGGGGFGPFNRRKRGVAHVAWGHDIPGQISPDTDYLDLPLSNSTGHQGWIYAIPLFVDTGTIERLALYCHSGFSVTVGTGKFRLGIYDDDDFFPGSPLIDSGELTGVADSLVEATVSVSVSRDNLYWAVIHVDEFDLGDLFVAATVNAIGTNGAATGMLGYPWTDVDTIDTNLTTCIVGFAKQIGALAALPDPFPADASNIPAVSSGTRMPAIWHRYT